MKIRMKTRDIAFTYRMGAGFPGDVNRTHPAGITPEPIDTTNPANAYGIPLLLDATSHNVRRYIAADANASAAPAFGFAVRPFPIQQSTATNFGEAAIGAATPPVSGILDVLKSGFIMAKLTSPTGAAVKGGTVYVWCAAASGNHVPGGIEDVATGGSTIPLSNAYFNGVPDSNGNVEIAFNI